MIDRWRDLVAARGDSIPAIYRRCDLVVVFAVSEGEWRGVEDLLESLRVYLDCDFEVVAIDDATTDGTYERLLGNGLWVVRNPKKKGLEGLDETIARGLKRSLDLFEAPYFLKIDPDALVIGEGLYSAIRSKFDEDPATGLIGTYQFDWNGERRDLSFWSERMQRQRHTIRRPLTMAIRNGYSVGDGVQGGAYVLRRECLAAIERHGWLQRSRAYRPPHVRGRQIAEDSLITMLTYAVGYKAADFGGPEQPFGIWDVGLPMAPEELVRQGRLVTHSIKYDDPEAQAQRQFFRERRLARQQALVSRAR